MKKLSIITALATTTATVGSFGALAGCSNSINLASTNTVGASKYCKIKFKVPEGATITGADTVSVRKGKTFSTVVKPTATKERCTFLGWYDNNDNKYTDDKVITGDDTMVLTAKFSQPEYEQFKVILFLNGGTSAEGKSIIEWTTPKKENPTLGDFDTSTITPSTDMEFDSWYDSYGNKIEDGTSEVINSNNQCYYAGWKDATKDFASCDWSYIQTKAAAYEKGEITAEKFAKSFKNVKKDVWNSTDSKWDSIDSPTWDTATGTSDKQKLEDIFVGATKEMEVNGSTHIMRIVGVNHDELTTQPTGKTGVCAAFTWEFKTLLSDSSGYSITVPWNWENGSSSTSFDYRKSNIYYALEHDTTYGANDAGWYYYTGTQSSTTKATESQGAYYNKSVLEMLPITPVQVKKKIVTTTGTAWTDADKTKDPTGYNAKVFLPTMVEVGWDKATGTGTKYWNSNEGKIYSFWDKSEFTTTSYSQCIHKQVTHDNTYSNTGKTITDGKYSAYNYAGLNSTAGDTGNGSNFWLSSPCVDSYYSNGAYLVYNDGYWDWYYVYNLAFPVSPNFCI